MIGTKIAQRTFNFSLALRRLRLTFEPLDAWRSRLVFAHQHRFQGLIGIPSRCPTHLLGTGKKSTLYKGNDDKTDWIHHGPPLCCARSPSCTPPVTPDPSAD